MKWSWRVGTVTGIGVYIHATFLLIIGWVGWMAWRESRTIEGTLAGIAFVLVLFGCVLLHEFGHALTARRYGIKTRDITLLPIGGVARLERMPDDPKQELWVALAGPAVNLVIAAVLFLWLLLTVHTADLDDLSMLSGSVIIRLMTINIVLAVFNMIPAFPMDGGRVLRALLATRLPYTRATQMAASLGQSLALAFAFIGLFYEPWLIFIAFFVWIGAAQESSMVQLKESLHGIPVSRAMLTDFRTLTPDQPLSDVVELILIGSQHDFPVTEQDRVVGILMQNDLLIALTRKGIDIPVSEVMRREFKTVTPNEMLQTLFIRMQDSACNCRTVPVLQHGRLVGMVTKENVGEFLEIQAALAESKGLGSGTA